MKKELGGLVASSLFLLAPTAKAEVPRIAPQPSACVIADFSTIRVKPNRQVTLKLTNKCGEAVDMQNVAVSFESSRAINTTFTGNWGELSAPDSELKITSTQQLFKTYNATFSLHFSGESHLNNGNSISITYLVDRDRHKDGTAKVYLTEPVNTGTIRLNNTSAQPTGVIQTNAIIHVTQNGKTISDVKVPWSASQLVPGLAAGNYTLSADKVTGTNGEMYQGATVPPSVDVTANSIVESNVNYKAIVQNGQLSITLQNLPSELAGYAQVPSVQVTGGGTATTANLIWGGATMVTKLSEGQNYQFVTPSISYKGAVCSPSFSPASVIASATNVASTNLTYNCATIPQDTISINVTGAPATLTSLTVTLTPNNGSSPVVQNITLANGSGTSTVSLTDGVIYNVSAAAVSGYEMKFNPQPLTAKSGGSETISLSAVGSTPVAKHGQLHVCGTFLCDEHNEQVQLKGMSTHGLQWYGPSSSHNCLTPASLDTLANVWHADIMRISMYIQEDGYETNPDGFTNVVNNMIAEVSKRGMYALVDWHMLDPGDPNYNLERAKVFFPKIIGMNKGRNNLLFEIANEPSGVPWSTIKSYAEKLIPVIRAAGPLSPILVGTPAWSSLGVSDGRTSADITAAPVEADNIMYTFHFYAASHLDEYYNELDKASNVLPIFVTEFGTQKYTGDGGNNFTMSQKYLDLLAKKKIGWTSWNYSDDKRSGAVWLQNTCSNGPWTDNKLKEAGVWIKAKILG